MSCFACIDREGPGLDLGKSGQGAAVRQHGAEIRVEKVLDVKRQLMEGRYTLAEKLDVVVDRLIENLL
jgi:hypothetical protein